MKRIASLFLAPVIIATLLFVPSPLFKSAGAADERPKAPVQSQWDVLVKAAKQEGRLTIYGTDLADARTAITQAFKEKYGIGLEIISGRPAEIIAKITAERNAGLFLQDVGLIGNSSFIEDIQPLGITIPLDDLLVLPEVRDTAKWRNGEIPYLGRGRQSIAMVAMATPVAIRNTELVKENEITSFLDFVKPKWKGKFILSDPAVAGSINNFFTIMATKTFGLEKTLEIMKQIAAQEPVLTRDQNLLQEWVARGKYPLALGQSASGVTRLKKTGAPLDFIKLKEPTFISSGSGNLMVFDKSPHPNAAKLFVNWLLSREGASIWSVKHGYPSQRIDVSKEAWDPVFLPPPGSTIPDENYLKMQGELRKVANDVFATLRK